MTDESSPKRRRFNRSGQPFVDNAGHMNPAHAERLRQLGQTLHTTEASGFLRGLTHSDQDLAGSIAEETVATLTSGQQQQPSPATLEDLADLSIDDPADQTDVEGRQDAVEQADSER